LLLFYSPKLPFDIKTWEMSSSDFTPPSSLSTSSHPNPSTTTTDPSTTNQSVTQHGDPKGDVSSSNSSSSAELTRLTVNLRAALRQFSDFPSPGILFEDIMPIFANHSLHSSLIRALELHVLQTFTAAEKPDVIVGLEARGFLFGPSLALRIGAAFVPVRKKGKLPGPTVEATYQKEYGTDFFQLQSDAIKEGQKVLIVDDIIATGKPFQLHSLNFGLTLLEEVQLRLPAIW
jgi:adenine phosphoribosyltransferase